MTRRKAVSDNSRAYKLTFNDESAKIVLKDLAEFCRANTSCFDPDPRMHSLLEGRREVFLRIMYHIDLSEDQLLHLFNATTIGETND